MIVCSCDSIIDSGFEILDPQGQRFDVEDDEWLKAIMGWGEWYTIFKAEEWKEYEKYLGDRWRKIVLEVKPLEHIEA